MDLTEYIDVSGLFTNNKLNKNMKKSDLKTGMYIEFESGCRSLVMLGSNEGDIIMSVSFKKCVDSTFERLYDHFSLDHWNEDLTTGCHVGNIVKIYDSYAVLIWEKKEKEKVVVEIDGIEYSESTLRSIIKKATI